jgi:hypothetical protein
MCNIPRGDGPRWWELVVVSRVGFRGYVLEEVLAFLIRNAGYRLLMDPSQEEVEEAVEAAHTTPGLDEAAVKETLAKYIDADQLAQRLALPRERWPTLRERLREQLIPDRQLQEMLGPPDVPPGRPRSGCAGRRSGRPITGSR